MQDPSGHGRELISFRIGAQEFCIGVAVVREIRGWTQATPLPHAPSYVRGVINLRGAVLRASNPSYFALALSKCSR